MTNHFEHEPTELTAHEMESISGGTLVSVQNEYVVVNYHPITSPGSHWYHPPSKKRPG